MGMFVLDGGERSSKPVEFFLAPRVFEGEVGDYSGTSTFNWGKNDKYCGAVMPSDTTELVQVFLDGGWKISGQVGSTSTTLYLGHKLEYDMEHTNEGGLIVADLKKGGISLAQDVSGFSISEKFTTAGWGAKELREIVTSSKTATDGWRSIEEFPDSEIFNNFWLLSKVMGMADGSFIVRQYRRCRITLTDPTGGGGEEHLKSEVTITPLPDPFVTKNRIGSEAVFSTGAIFSE